MLRTNSNRRLLLAAAALAAASSSCATVAGTVTSPLTGGVDAVVEGYDNDAPALAPLLFIGGTIAAPFVAFYNGINFDAAGMNMGAEYWDNFDMVFRPYEMLRKGNLLR